MSTFGGNDNGEKNTRGYTDDDFAMFANYGKRSTPDSRDAARRRSGAEKRSMGAHKVSGRGGSRRGSAARKRPTPKKKPAAKPAAAQTAEMPAPMKWLLRILGTFLLIIMLTFFIMGCYMLVYVFNKADSSIDFDLNNLTLNENSIIYLKDESGNYYEYQRLHSDENRIWANLETIPANLQNAFVAIEDKRFYDHDGVDWRRTAKATMMYASGGTQGGSTITQQLIKNLTQETDQTVDRKIKEISRALKVEKDYSKETILECYLNRINLGGGCYGVQTAAEYYFGKPVEELSLVESAAIASITQNPSVYDPFVDLAANTERRNLVLYDMLCQGMITQAEFNEAVNSQIVLDYATADDDDDDDDDNEPDGKWNYFVDQLFMQVHDDLMEQRGYSDSWAYQMIYTGGLRIYATMDTKIQSILENVYEDPSNFPVIGSSDEEQPESAMMVMDYEGNVVGTVGGRGEKNGNLMLNRCTMSPRQPGSSIKPLSVYTPAIEYDLINYSSKLSDTRVVYNAGFKNEWVPYNYDKTFSGTVSLEYAIKKSLNTIPAYLVNEMGTSTSYTYLLDKFNMSTVVPGDNDLSPLAVGAMTYGVTVQDMTAAYATFGNGGKYYQPKTYYSVTDADGNVVLEREKAPTMAMSPETAAVMNSLMQRVIADPAGTAYSTELGDMAAFAKTGTSDFNDNWWICGGTPYYAAVVWFGYDLPSEMPTWANRAGKNVWFNVMRQIHMDLPNKEFEFEGNVHSKIYCMDTGELARSGCSHTSVGWYKDSNLPSDCSWHGGSSINKDGNNEGSYNVWQGGGDDDEPDEPDTDAPATDEPDSPDTDEPEQPATDEPEPPATDEPEPPATDEPEPPVTDEPEPPNEGGE